MYYYALALRRSSFLMVNSSWTKNHVDAILDHRDPLLDLIHLPFAFIGGLFSSTRTLALSSPTRVHAIPKRAEIVYPPCDTEALYQLPLERRPSLLLSLAQFRYVVSVQSFFFAFVLMRGKARKRPRGTDSYDGHVADALSRTLPVYAPVTRRRSAQRGRFCASTGAERTRRFTSGLGMLPSDRMHSLMSLTYGTGIRRIRSE
jgi:hypothetical protein